MEKNNYAMIIYHCPDKAIVKIPSQKANSSSSSRKENTIIPKEPVTQGNARLDLPMFYQRKIRGRKFDLF